MLRKAGILTGLVALGALGLDCHPAAAQIAPGTHELHVYAGYLFGDDLTDTPVTGATPELDDDFTVGARYGYDFNEAWGLDVSLGYNPNSVTNLTATGDIDLDIITADVDAVWNFMPTAKLVPYALVGLGYAFADLDTPIAGIANGQPVVINDDNGFTANAGVGVKYFFTEGFQLRAEARYRYVDKLVDTLDDSLNTFETTIGVGMTL